MAEDWFTIERRFVEYELGCFNFVYRTDDGDFLTRSEAFDELTPTMAEGLEGLPPEEQVLDGADAEEFIFESGIYKLVEAEGRVVVQYTDGQTRWTDELLREQVFSTVDHAGVSFKDWLAGQLDAGTLKVVEILQYIGYEDEDADEETVITERVIVD